MASQTGEEFTRIFLSLPLSLGSLTLKNEYVRRKGGILGTIEKVWWFWRFDPEGRKKGVSF